MRRVWAGWLVAAAAMAGGCSGSAEMTAAERGERIYMSNCIACHHAADPARDGPTGPAIAGSSEALVEARIMRAEYPPGYTPKRESTLMPAQPFLRKDIPDIAAFLMTIEADGARAAR